MELPIIIGQNARFAAAVGNELLWDLIVLLGKRKSCGLSIESGEVNALKIVFIELPKSKTPMRNPYILSVAADLHSLSCGRFAI